MKDRRTGFKKYDSVLDRYRFFIDDSGLCVNSKKILWDFKEERCANGIKDDCTMGLLGTIVNIGEAVGKDFLQTTSDDLKTFFGRMTFKPTQELVYKKGIILFYRWLSKHKNDPNFLLPVYWINTRHLSRKCTQEAAMKRDENVPSSEETRRMISEAMLLRDKLAIAMLADTGCRAETIGASRNKRSISVGQVEFHKGYASINGIKGKFDKPTTLIITESLSYLIKYWNELPENHKKNPDNPLFMCYSKNEFGKRWSYPGLRYMLHKISEKAIGRIINPHDFRHAKATRLDSDKNLSEDTKCKLMQWSNRRMLERYSHRRFSDARKEYLQEKGIIPAENNETTSTSTILQPKECMVCHHINSITDTICENCGNTLDYKSIIKEVTEQEHSKDELTKFMQPEEIQKLFKIIYKLEKRINQIESN